jgi:hypothetical protein
MEHQPTSCLYNQLFGCLQDVAPYELPPGGNSDVVPGIESSGPRGVFNVKSQVWFGALPVQLKLNRSGRLHGPFRSGFEGIRR